MTPITIDQIRQAIHPEDVKDFVVTDSVCELVGLTWRSDEGKAKFHAWMNGLGWEIIGEAAGCVHWSHASGSHIWVEDMLEYAVPHLLRAITGRLDDLLPQHGVILSTTDRTAIELLGDILGTEADAPARAESAKTTGGGSMWFDGSGALHTTSWGE